jgi:hypothetical protein
LSKQNIAHTPAAYTYHTIQHSLYENFIDTINDRVIARDPASRILMINESRTAFIRQHDRHVIPDQLMFYWGALRQELPTFEAIHQELKEQGIGYIIFSGERREYLLSFADPTNLANPILADLEAFDVYASGYLDELTCDQDLCLYQLRPTLRADESVWR